MTPPQHQHQRLPGTWTRHVARTSRVHHQPPPHKPPQRSIIHVLLSLCVVFTTVVVVVVVVVEAKVDRNAPHGHRGKLSPYPPGPFVGLILTKDDEQTLERGDSVMKQTLPTDDSHSSGGAAICVQDVHAPITAVWAQILHMEEYPNKVNKVLKCENYQVQEEDEEEEEKGTNKQHVPKKILRIKTKQVLGVLPGYSVRPYHARALSRSLSLL